VVNKKKGIYMCSLFGIIMTQADLETKTGPLADIYSLFFPKTIQHADEITAARRNNPDLRTISHRLL
jgi:hypothetical protein